MITDMAVQLMWDKKEELALMEETRNAQSDLIYERVVKRRQEYIAGLNDKEAVKAVKQLQNRPNRALTPFEIEQ